MRWYRVSRLAEDAAAGRESAFPGAVLLPPGAVDDRVRWLRARLQVDPAETVASWLGLPDGAVWEDVVGPA